MLAIASKTVYIVYMIKIEKNKNFTKESKTMTHSQMLAIAKKEEEDRIKDLLEQCGMLCDDIVEVSARNKLEEKRHSTYAYHDAKHQREAREKALSSTS